MATYVTLVNELLRRMNEVTLDTAGDGFDSVRNVQALAKDAVNSSIRLILQDGQEWPFLKTTFTQALTVGTRQYDFPADYSSTDWDTFYLKKLSSENNSPMPLTVISYEQYIQNVRPSDDTGDQVNGDGPPALVYQTLGTAFGVSPIPNAAYEIEYVYWKFPTDLTAFNDVAIIPDRFKHVVIDGAMMFMMRFRSNEQSAAMHQNNFEDGIKTMRRVLIDDTLFVRSTVVGDSRTSSFTSGV
mgnify:FL=1|jgi:hypothetical protein|tara:strand:- start:246 stop:971 length:726 start_codon:yes stop_codon:yes gene_type:complete